MERKARASTRGNENWQHVIPLRRKPQVLEEELEVPFSRDEVEIQPVEAELGTQQDPEITRRVIPEKAEGWNNLEESENTSPRYSKEVAANPTITRSGKVSKIPACLWEFHLGRRSVRHILTRRCATHFSDSLVYATNKLG